MSGAPKVDFAILSHNRASSAIVAIRSMLVQERVDGHVHVVDQNSQSDQLAKLLGAYAADPRVTIFRSPVNLGVPAGRNKANSLGNAPYIIWLDEDARFADAWQARRAIAIAESDPHIGAIGFSFVDEHGVEQSTSTDMRSAAENGSYVGFLGAGFLLRREAVEAAGGFDPRLSFCHDEGDLCVRLVNMGWRIVFGPEVVAIHPFVGSNWQSAPTMTCEMQRTSRRNMVSLSQISLYRP